MGPLLRNTTGLELIGRQPPAIPARYGPICPPDASGRRTSHKPCNSARPPRALWTRLAGFWLIPATWCVLITSRGLDVLRSLCQDIHSAEAAELVHQRQDLVLQRWIMPR